MAQNITWLGATWQNVPALTLPKSGGGTALFADPSVVTATASDVVLGKNIINASGDLTAGSLVVQTYYTGSGNPSASLGANGDIYLKTV